MRRSLTAVALLFCSAAPALAQPARTPTPPRLLPGVERDGSVRLHNQWAIRPAGRVRTLPSQAASMKPGCSSSHAGPPAGCSWPSRTTWWANLLLRPVW